MVFLSFFGVVNAGESIDGKSYSNFGMDLVAPAFPKNGTLAIFENKDDATAKMTFKNKKVVRLSGNVAACIKNSPDLWVRCTVNNITGWAKQDDFRSGADVEPMKNWPFRYWIYIASSGVGSEETTLLRNAATKNPYLITPSEYDNIFFEVIFDKEGHAISPKTHQPTGERVFVVDDAVYLASEDPKKRAGSTWLFLAYYNAEMNALCPGKTTKSCMNSVNKNSSWQGIKDFYKEPPSQFQRTDDDEAWFGNGETAFARHSDLIQAFMYRVPDDVYMRADKNASNGLQRKKNREKLFCIADCS